MTLNRSSNLNHEAPFALGTIQVLRQHVFGFLGPPPTPAYIILQISKNHHFLTPPTHLFANVILEWSPLCDGYMMVFLR